MCNLYSMTATVAEMRNVFGAFDGDRTNLPAFVEIYPDREAPVLRSGAAGRLELALMRWGIPPPGEVKRPVTNVRNLHSPFWRAALARPDRRCLIPVTAFSEWSAKPDPATGRRRKHWFALVGAAPEERPLFAFAGLWRPAAESDRYAFLTSAQPAGRSDPSESDARGADGGGARPLASCARGGGSGARRYLPRPRDEGDLSGTFGARRFILGRKRCVADGGSYRGARLA